MTSYDEQEQAQHIDRAYGLHDLVRELGPALEQARDSGDLTEIIDDLKKARHQLAELLGMVVTSKWKAENAEEDAQEVPA